MRQINNETKIDEYVVLPDVSVIEAMKKIDQNTKGILYVVDEERKLLGSITDGDIRRWIIRNGSISAPVKDVMCNTAKFLLHTCINGAVEYMNKEKITSVPIVDDGRVIIDICFYRNNDNTNNYAYKSLGNTPVIIMAGGKGSRLKPYTNILPKPLIPIGNTPILERIMNRFEKFGTRKFYLVVNYKREIIKSYFSEVSTNYDIEYIDENEPLGTAGGITLINDKFDVPVIITNCDILIVADYGAVLDHHNKSNNDLTIVSALKNTIIPYGVLHSGENGIIESMEEKPHISSFINTGMYIINPDCLEMIPHNVVFHMTDLAEILIKEGKRVGMYPISEDSFFDMGEFEEMKRMEDWITKEYTF